MAETTDKPRMKIPAEAVELYTQYIHGEITRRDFMDTIGRRFAVAGLTTAAIVEALMPNYALGQQVRKDDERIKATWETIPSPSGNGYIRGYFVRPFSQDTRTQTPTKLPTVLVVHENRGLNPHTQDVARRFALENFMAFAPDALTTVGGYPDDDYEGGQSHFISLCLCSLKTMRPFYQVIETLTATRASTVVTSRSACQAGRISTTATI
jgi:carboxymethylenebutenolidase